MTSPTDYPLEQLEPSAPPPPPGSPERVLAEAVAEAERIRAHAQAEGHAEGLARGREDGHADARAAAEALNAALVDIDGEREALTGRLERDAVEFALMLAAKLVAGSLEVQPERVLDVVAGALRHFTDRRRITVLVDVDDLDLVRESIGELAAQAGGVEYFEVQAERRVGRGGAIVRTQEREVDAGVKVQLERAREVVAAELGVEGDRDER